MSMTSDEFAAMHRKAKEDRVKSGMRTGPQYGKDGQNFSPWFDQAFQRRIAPASKVFCEQALRVGSTQNGLEVVLVASHDNIGNLVIAEDATITLVTMQADKPEDTFVDVGPSICVKSPADGITVEPDMVVARFAIGNFNKPWLKIRLEFEGAISGGNLDAFLGYAPR